MQSLSYKPRLFFSGTLLFTYCVQFLAAYMSYHTQFVLFLFPLILIGMGGPSIMAFILFMTAKNKNLWNDFCQRLRLSNIKMYFVPLIIAFWPCLILLAITLSLLFGLSTDQFLMFQGSLDSALAKISFLGLCGVVFLSCSLEEIGWRGYGIESLNNKYNLFYSSLIFAAIWCLWHVPAFFIKGGYFQNMLQDEGMSQVIIYFISYFPITILMNWLYVKNNRSIIVVILSHAVMNISYGYFHIQPFTKIILMVLLLVIAGIVVIKDRKIFTEIAHFK